MGTRGSGWDLSQACPSQAQWLSEACWPGCMCEGSGAAGEAGAGEATPRLTDEKTDTRCKTHSHEGK